MKKLNEKSLDKVSGGVAQPGKKPVNRKVYCYYCKENVTVSDTGVGSAVCPKCTKKIPIPVNNVMRA